MAKTSNDEQPGIRTNTTICLGKIAKNLGISTRSKVLIAAFTRSLRDPFVHARNAALMALGVTVDMFNDDDCANRILPTICPALIDKERLVRDQANKVMDIYLTKVRKSASSMPDSVLPPPSAVTGNNTPRMSTPQPSESASWTGWAISSFTNKISAAAGEIQATSNGSARPDTRPNSVPLPDTRRPYLSTSSASVLHRQAVASPSATSTRTSLSSNANDYFADPDVAADDGDAWGDMDEDSFFDASTDATPVASTSTTSRTKLAAAAIPFEDDGEPDFAGWLAAQSQKKPGAKPLPKGLAKSATSTPAVHSARPAVPRITTTGKVGLGAGVKKASSVAAVNAASVKPVVAKKIDTTPKVADDDDAWGDNWD